MRELFKTILKEKDIWTDSEQTVSECTIHWGVDIELKEWGIKSIDTFILSASFPEMEGEWEIIDEIPEGLFYIESVEIQFEEQKIVIS